MQIKQNQARNRFETVLHTQVRPEGNTQSFCIKFMWRAREENHTQTKQIEAARNRFGAPR